MDTATDAPDTATRGYRLWRDRRYLTWLASDTSAGLSMSLSGFAIALIALTVTHSPVQAGTITAVSLAARLLATLGGGVLADRRNRFTLMTVGAIVGVLVSAGFLVLTLMGAVTFGTLLTVSVLLSVRAGLFGVAGEAAIKQIVPSDTMGRAQAANQGRDAALNVAGGPLGGVLLAIGGWAIAAAMAACQLISLLTAATLRRGTHLANEVEEDPPREPSSMWAEIREGVVWIFRRRDLRDVLLVATIVNLGFTTAMTTIIYSLQLSGHSAQQIGMLSAIASLAMIAGAAISPALVTRVPAGVLTLGGLTLSGIGVAAISRVDAYPAIVAILAVSVIGVPPLNSALMGYAVVATPSRLLGRVSSASSVLSMGAMPVAPLIAGVGLATIGRTWTLTLAAAICAIAVILAFTSRPLRDLPREKSWAEHSTRFATA